MNRLYFGDNLKWLSDRKEFPDASVDLVYLDSPFNSNADYTFLFREPSGQVSQAQFMHSPIRVPSDLPPRYGSHSDELREPETASPARETRALPRGGISLRSQSRSPVLSRINRLRLKPIPF